MGMSRDALERQLVVAKQHRDLQSQKLSEQGRTEKQYRKDPQWRHLHATCRQLVTRLLRVGKKEQLRVGDSSDD